VERVTDWGEDLSALLPPVACCRSSIGTGSIGSGVSTRVTSATEATHGGVSMVFSWASHPILFSGNPSSESSISSPYSTPSMPVCIGGPGVTTVQSTISTMAETPYNSRLTLMHVPMGIGQQVPPLGKFSGTDAEGECDSFDEWVKQFELIADLYEWARLVNLTTRLQGQAYSLYRTCSP